MQKFRVPSYSQIVFWLCLGTVTLWAQADKVVMRLAPQPNQTASMRMIQDINMEMTFEGNVPPELAAQGPMKMTGKTVTAFTQKTGAPNQQGQLEAEITYDQMTSEMNMNGQAIPMPDQAGKVVGKKITVIYDGQGKIADVKVPDDMGLPADALKEMMKSLYGNLPDKPMGINETATVPYSIALPLPIPGSGPLRMEGQITYKLLALEKDGTDRIGKFDQTMDAKLFSTVDIPSPNGPSKMKLDFKMSGTGDMQLNLDKGVLKTSQVLTTIDGKMSAEGEAAGGKMPNIKLHGTTKMQMSGSLGAGAVK